MDLFSEIVEPLRTTSPKDNFLVCVYSKFMYICTQF